MHACRLIYGPRTHVVLSLEMIETFEVVSIQEVLTYTWRSSDMHVVNQATYYHAGMACMHGRDNDGGRTHD